MAESDDEPERILQGALELAAARGWQDVTLADIARAAGVSLARLYQLYPGKSAILAAYMRRVDAAVLSGETPFEAEESPRDRLFEILMQRFDVLARDRAAVAGILRDLPRDPPAALAALPTLARSMAWMLEAANIPSDGVAGRLRAQGLAAIWLSTLRVWVDDDSPDMARTMAALDRNLRRAEGLARLLRPRRGRAATGGAEDVPGGTID